MLFKFQGRRGTPEQWAAQNPILADGEPGIESGTGKFKIGDGATAWSNLSYYLNQDAMQIYINEAIANADPIGPEDVNHIVDMVVQELDLPDLTLLWENAIV
jgi:hypothetical protein